MVAWLRSQRVCVKAVLVKRMPSMCALAFTTTVPETCQKMFSFLGAVVVTPAAFAAISVFRPVAAALVYAVSVSLTAVVKATAVAPP
jgi:hypothetical protein